MENFNPAKITRDFWQLEKKYGNIQFGFMAQAILAAIFYNMGYKIYSFKTQGHPDIQLRKEGVTLKIEVEVIGLNRYEHAIKIEDITAIKPSGFLEQGYFALLDLHMPCRWYLIEYASVLRDGHGNYSIIKLKSMSDKNLSQDCTNETYSFIENNKTAIMDRGYNEIMSFFQKN